MAEPLRLLVVGADWPPETFIERLLRGLAARGVQVTLATSARPDTAWLGTTGVRWMPAPVWGKARLADFLALLGHFLRSLLSARADLRHLWRAMPPGGPQTWQKRLAYWLAFAPFLGRRWDLLYFPWNSAAVHYLPLYDLGMPVLVSCRGAQINIAPHNPQRGDFLPPLRHSLERAARVHCVSQDILEQTVPLGLDPARAVVIRPAVETDFFTLPAQPRPARPDLFRVITAGSLIWRKGYEYALSAIRRLVDAGIPVQFEVIGAGPERTRLLFTIQDLDLGAHVRLLGRQSPEGVRESLQRADAFLFASLSEGISNSVLEAMACGLPVVTTDCGGMREAVTDGVEGFVVPVRDPAAMAGALAQLWQQSELRQRMGQAGRDRVVAGFQLSLQVEQWTNILLQVTRGKT